MSGAGETEMLFLPGEGSPVQVVQAAGAALHDATPEAGLLAAPDTHRDSWRSHLFALTATIAGMVLLFHADAVAMADQWVNASTYQHCLFIMPITGWLIWQRRHEVAPIAPQAWAPGLAIIALAAFAWLMGEAAGVSVVRHAALVFAVQASVLTILGPNATRALLFPVFYLIFLVPFGDEFVPMLQTMTAKIVIALIHVTGLKAQIDGVFITTDAGWFEVAEACSGVKFLVAMVAYGALVANVCFRAWRRRAAFMALCIVVPVIANGVRAFSTIYAAHLTSVDVATGYDHVIYGWFFFAIVMMLIMAAGWRFFDRRPTDPWLVEMPIGAWRKAETIPVALAALGIATMPIIWTDTVIAAGRAALPNPVALPVLAGWSRVTSQPATPWIARFDGADHRLYGRYQDSNGHVVDIAIALYGWQGHGRKIIGFGQGAIDPAGRWKWAGELPAPAGARAERLMGAGKLARTAISFYLLGNGATGDTMTVKLQTLQRRLLGGDQRAAVIIVSAEDRPDTPAREALQPFLVSFGDPQVRADRLFAQAGAR